MRTTRILPPGPYGEAFAGFSAFASSRTNGEALGAPEQTLSRSSRRKVEAIASVFLAIRVAVQLLLLLLVFQ